MIFVVEMGVLFFSSLINAGRGSLCSGLHVKSAVLSVFWNLTLRGSTSCWLFYRYTQVSPFMLMILLLEFSGLGIQSAVHCRYTVA